MEKTKNSLVKNNAWFRPRSVYFNLKNFNKIILLLIIIAGVSYIARSNDLAVKGFTLSNLKRERNKVAEENSRLELRAMTLSSYGAISEKINDLKMVAVGNIEYINGSQEAVAKK